MSSMSENLEMTWLVVKTELRLCLWWQKAEVRVEKVTMRVRGQRTKRLGFCSFPLPPAIKLLVPLGLGNC